MPKRTTKIHGTKSMGAGPFLPEDERYSQTELQTLLDKARSFVDVDVRLNRMQHRECKWFYREKMQSYYENILQNNNGLMTVYAKDNHGDPKNPINGNIDGLFFTPIGKSKNSGKRSIYGDTRLQMSPQKLVSNAPNVYFADFYCVNPRKQPHYVELVMTEPGSKADEFCKEHLIQLSLTDYHENPFFYGQLNDDFPAESPSMINPSDLTFYVVTCPRRSIWVEILYTNDIDITKEHLVYDIPMRGKRSGGDVGLLKQYDCNTCSLRPGSLDLHLRAT